MVLEKENENFKFVCPEKMITEKAGREYRNIVHVTYHSTTTDSERGANVVLPLGYTEEKKYPVLYVFHGIFGHEGTMLYDEDSRIPEILGNMYDAGEAKEVIAVFANIYATSDPNMAPGFSPETLGPYNDFIDDFINDLDPYICSNYSVAEGRENKALLGFSMGARVAVYIAFKRSDLIKNVCAVAPAPGLIYGKDWAMEHMGLFDKDKFKVEQEDEPLDIFLLCRGSKDSVVGRFPVEYHEVLDANGAEHIWYEAPGLEHGEPIVQSALYNFMKMWK